MDKSLFFKRLLWFAIIICSFANTLQAQTLDTSNVDDASYWRIVSSRYPWNITPEEGGIVSDTGVFYDNGGINGNMALVYRASVFFYALPGDTIHVWGNIQWDDDSYILAQCGYNGSTQEIHTSTLDLSTDEGFMEIYFYGLNYETTYAGFELFYTISPSSCANAVRNLHITSSSTSSAEISWDPANYSLQPYLISYGLYNPATNTYTLTDTTHSNFSYTTINNLSRNTHYYITVVSTADSGSAPCADTVICRTPLCTDSILSAHVVDSTASTITISWYAENNTPPYIVSCNGHDTLVNETECRFENLQHNTAYTFTVRQQNDLCCDECGSTVTGHTTCYQAVVNGIRPLIGNDAVTLTADPADSYLWSTGETTQSITVTSSGYYWLKVFGSNCYDSVAFGISDYSLDLNLSVPSSLCPGESADVLVGFGLNTNVTINRNTLASMSDPTRIFLPDGQDCDPTSDHGCSYRSELEFNGFGNYQIVTSPNDIQYVMLNIEHSYIGDLYVNITCPNGQSADILRFDGNGMSYCTSSIGNDHRGWAPGNNLQGASLGLPIDQEDTQFPCDSTAPLNAAGTGWRYCWSNNNQSNYSFAPGDGLIYRFDNLAVNNYSMDSSNVAAGTNFYHPDQSFASLRGCPMNGSWYIEVIDGWGVDNGYIFGWELALNPDRLSRNSYQPSLATADLQGMYHVRTSDSTFTITAPTNLTHDTIVHYTVTINDTLGHSFDTTFTITFHPSPTNSRTIIIAENQLPYTVYGTTFADEVTDSLLAVPQPSGCDSLIYLTLRVIRNTAYAYDSVACANTLPFLWHGTTITAAGTYTATIPNALGADSLITLNLTLASNHEITTTATACDSIVVMGQTYTQNTTLTQQLTNQWGCDSVVHLNLVVEHSPTITHTPDTIVQCYRTTNLWAAGATNYEWYNAAGSYLGNGPLLRTYVTRSGYYYIHSTLMDNNRVVNGDFEQGNTGFTSQYTYMANGNGNLPQDYYAVTPQPASFISDFSAYDHTLGNGKMLIANGSNNSSHAVWQQTVSVEPNTEYQFTFWAHKLIFYSVSDENLPLLRVKINGSSLGSDTRLSNSSDWQQITHTWNSGSSTSATIAIYDINTTDGANDFGLDDISLSTQIGCQSVDSFYVTAITYVSRNICSDLMPYTWGNLTFATAGTQIDTLTDIYGLDSLVCRNVEVVPSYHNTLNQEVCDNVPYYFDGTLITASGTYTANHPTLLYGCDSSTVLNLTIHHHDSAHISGRTHLVGTQDTVTLTAAPAGSYLWSTGDTTQSIRVFESGRYTLVANPDSICPDTTFVNINRLHPALHLNIPDSICPGQSVHVNVGSAEDNNIVVGSSRSTLSVGERIFLPDGQDCDPSSDHGCSYRSQVVFDGFDANQVITSVNDIHYVMLNIEHSFIGDLYINITCPNGQSADILRFYGSGSSNCTSSIGAEHRGWSPGSNTNSTHFGNIGAYDNTANKCDSTLNPAGTGWRYCWSNNTDQNYTYAMGDGLVYRDVNRHGNIADSSHVAAGTQFYHPDQSFASLVGCPMNGAWYIEVIDGWGVDNGYIFGWELALNPDLLSVGEYNPAIDSAHIVGSFAQQTSDTTFSITAPSRFETDTTVLYSVTVFDSIGTTFDTSFSITFLPTPTRTVLQIVAENDLPVTAFGQTFADTVTNLPITWPDLQGGCDSLITYTLRVIRNTSSTLDSTICPHQLPFSWNGATFTAAGILSATIPNALGADSLINMTVSLHPTYTHDHHDTTCANQPYLFHDTTLTTTDLCTRHLPTIHGCDSAVTLHLTVHPIASTSHSDTIVQNQLAPSYTYHDTTFLPGTTSGTYTFHRSTTLGCDSTHSLHLHIWPNVSTTLDSNFCNLSDTTTIDTLSRSLLTTHGADSLVTIISHGHPAYHNHIFAQLCQGQSYTVGGTPYSATGEYLYTTTTALGCDSAVSLHLPVNPTYQLDYTDTTCADTPYPFCDTTYDTPGTYTHELTSTHGCDSVRTLQLTVYYPGTAQVYDTIVQNQLAPDHIYRGQHFTSDTTALLTFPLFRSCDSVITYNLHIWPNVSTTVDTFYCEDLPRLDTTYRHLTTSHGADSLVTIVHHVSQQYHLHTADTICAGDSALFQGSWYTLADDYDHHLTTAQGCDSLITLHLMVNPTFDHHFYDTIRRGDTILFSGTPYTTAGTYTHHLATTLGCDSTVTLHLSNRAYHQVLIVDSICMGSIYIFHGDTLRTPGTYHDTILATQEPLIDTAFTLQLVMITPYAITIDTAYNCGDNPQYLITANTDAPYITWHATPADPALDSQSHAAVIAVSPNAPTTYTAEVDHRPTETCPNQAQVEVTPIEPVRAIIEVRPEAITLEHRSIQAFNRSTGHYNQHLWYVWYDGALAFNSTERELTFDVPNHVDSLDISIDVTSSTCHDVVTLNIPILRSDIFFPNVFTPLLETNNRFMGIGNGILEYEIWIYDRFGVLVYHSTDQHEGWDGTSQGRVCPQANYVYQCRYTHQLIPNGWQTTKGSVTLLH
ncbi:MAG: gliding motility-associated C-terminal domain-containing protein [Bacteroidales bacterium]|nr:gliding motility-associated C-terminal domain-containing protein [Bacteroidales bacterium]